jgi:hypothetical protein
MAWMGKPNARQKGRLSRESRRRPHPLPKVDDPRGIPSSVLKGLAFEQLPLDRGSYQEKLNELLAAYKPKGE